MKPEQIYSIIEAKDQQSEFLENLDLADNSFTLHTALQEFYESYILHEVDSDEEKILALMEHTGDNWDECESAIDKSNYLVLDDDEADEKFDERLNQYLDDNVLPQLEPIAQQYFDRDAWKEDNKSDRGAWLNSWDGNEDYEVINSTTYYIYRN